MAKSPAEIQRAYRRRQKAKEDQQSDPATYVKGDFTAFTMSDDAIDFGEDGIFGCPGAIWSDAEDRLSKVGASNALQAPDWQSAERLAEELIESARLIAAVVNAFKRREIERAKEEIKNSDLTDPAVKDAAFREVAKLDAIKRRLRKRTRHDFETMSVKGEVGID